MPINIRQASGGPTRVVAFWGDTHRGAFSGGSPAGPRVRPLSLLLPAVIALAKLTL